MKEFYNIKYKPTGYVFTMEKAEVDRLIEEEPENFEVVDEDYNMPESAEKDKSTYEKVVIQVEEEKAEVLPKKVAKNKKK